MDQAFCGCSRIGDSVCFSGVLAANGGVLKDRSSRPAVMGRLGAMALSSTPSSRAGSRKELSAIV
jgi:hypothetical protein